MTIYQGEVLSPPVNLVYNGICNFGTFNGPIKNINILSVKRPFEIPSPKTYKNFRLKEWQAFQAGNSNIFMFGAIYNTKVIGLVILSIYDIEKKRRYFIKKFVPVCKMKIGKGMYNSQSQYMSDDISIKIKNKILNNRVFIEAKYSKTCYRPEIDLKLECFHITQPIVICHPLGKNTPLYSHKALMPMKGILRIDNEEIHFDKSNSFTAIDDNKGYYARTLKYDWITGMGNLHDGTFTGFNLTDNQVINPEKYNENCLWINGKMIKLGPIKVKRDYGDTKVWHIQDKYGMIDLNFYPKVKNNIKFKLMDMYCDYEGPFGTFEGYIRGQDNNIVRVDNFFGMGEKNIYRI